MTRLQIYGLTVDRIVDTAQDQLVDRGSGFHNNKVKSIKQLNIVKDVYDGLVQRPTQTLSSTWIRHDLAVLT
jgi:hypothetical protein